MAIKFSNNARTELVSSVESTDTTITVEDSSVFPTLSEGDVLYLTIANAGSTLWEIVKCTAIDGNVLTIVRGQEDTEPKNWTDQDNVSSRLTAELLETITSRNYQGLDVDDDVVFNSVQLAGGTGTQGKLSWNDIDKTIDVNYGNVTLQLGQEQHVYGKATEAIPNGAPVMFAGAQGDHILIARADQNALNFNPKWIIGLATNAMAENDFGYVTTFGAVRFIDTSAFAEGSILYLDMSSPGELTTTPLSAPNHLITMAAVTRSHQNEGTLFVRPSWSLDLHELCDVDLEHGNIGDQNLLVYNTATNTWTDTSTPTLDYIDFRAKEDITQAEGRVYYNNEYKALTVYNDIVGSSLQVGHEDWIRVYNGTGSLIPNGTPLYAVGAVGEIMSVAPADATTEEKARVIGVATNDIADSSQGVATVRGLISGIDTSGLTAGQPVHLSANGGFQNAAPTYPYFPVDLGSCIVSDATNGYIYVRVENHVFEQLRVTGNQHVDGSLIVDGDFIVNGTQSVVSQNNLQIADSFVYLNSGDNIGLENTTFTGSGLNDAYFAGYYEGPTTTSYAVRIDGVGTGTGGVDTFEWSKDNFATTEATGVDITGGYQELEYEIGIRFNATTGHTSGDSWSGTAAPINTDTGWATNRNTGATGVGYTHMGVFFDASDEKFKFFDQYAPEPEGTIDVSHESFSLGTVVVDTLEGTATNANKLNNQLANYYLNYNNFTNTPTIGNGTITVTAGSGLGTGGSFALNGTADKTVTLTNTDKGSSQNIFKTISVPSQNSIIAASNTDTVTIAGSGLVGVATDTNNNIITISANETSHADVLVDGDFTANGFMKRTGEGVYAVDTNSYALATHIHDYLPTAGGTMSGKVTLYQNNDIIGLSGTIANYPRLSFYSSEGTHAAKTQTLSGDLLGQLDFNPHTGASYTGGGKVTFVATENITSSNRGTEARIYSTKTGQAAQSYHQFKDDELYIKDVGGATYKYWHENNDGASSGLDADKLDGKHASEFALSGHTHTYDNYVSWTISDGTNSEAINSGNTLKVVGSGATSATYDTATNTLTISSTDTNSVYSHPSHPGDDINLDTGALTGATVISDLDFNVTTDTLGHVTDANATYSTRNLTAADIGAAASSHSHSYLPLSGGTLTGKLFAGSSDGNSLEIRNDTASAASSGYITFQNKNGTGTYRPAARISGVNIDNAFDGDFLIETYSGGNAYKGLRVDENSKVFFYDTSGNTKFEWDSANVRARINNNTVFHDGYHPNADKWTTARTNTVTLTGDVTGSGNASVDGSGNWTVSLSTTVGDNSHSHSYLPLSGGTLSGKLIVNAAGTSGDPTLKINNSSSASFVHSVESMASNITSGQTNISLVGQAASTKNSGYIGYYWAGAGSNSNFVSLGHWGADHLFRIYGDGNVTVGTNTVLHAGNYNSYAPTKTGGGASGTWGISITGNAATATKLATARTINGVSFDGSANITISASSSFDGLTSKTSGTGTYQTSGNFRAPIFYDSNDTGYYLDPASTGTSLQVAGTIEQGNNYAHPNIEWSASGSSTGEVIFYLPGTTSNYGMVHMVFDIYEYASPRTATVIIGGHNWSTSWYNTACNVIGYTDKSVRLGVKDGRFVVVFGGTGSSWSYGQIRLRKIQNGSYYNNVMDLGGNWSVTQTTSESFTSVTGDLRNLRTPSNFEVDGISYAYSSSRAPIFYDYNDTNYYADPASTSRLNNTHTNQSYTSGWFRNYTSGNGLYNEATGQHFYSDDDDYWNIAGGSAANGLRFRDEHAGTVRGYVYADNGNNIGFLNNSGNWRLRVVGGDYSLADGSSMRAQIFYDSNNTGYYVDAASTSVLYRLNINNNVYFTNYGRGMVGTYASTRYQAVFAMGDSYKLPDDGTTTGSLYGMAWSHPNAGGAAGNLTDHGLLIINNGGFRCAISNSIVASGNITAYSDERLKKNWRDMPENYVSRLADVKVGIYERIDDEVTQVGVSAQSFQKLLPEAIITAKDEINTLSVSYGNAALASAVELAKVVVEQDKRIKRLEALIEKLI